ncbi:unnamed protein product [Bemisia tabaci]|uniref:UDP-glucuronosyltransferase n=1 Tax=Bemisia tabaci TaxID=7038 RepID=A0A9P0ABC6_BEMTA|nr:unnamed protein product [Bemisia tabaci]
MRTFTSLFAVWMITGCFADNILVFLPVTLRSHYTQVEPLFQALALRGHNVTEVSPYPPKRKIINLTHIFYPPTSPGNLMGNQFEMAQSRPQGPFLRHWSKETFADTLIPSVLESSVFKDITQGDTRFDLIFTEVFFFQEAFVVLGHIFNAPIVAFSSIGYYIDFLSIFGAPTAAAYLLDKLGLAPPMNLAGRLQNVWEQYASLIYHEFYYYPLYDGVLSHYIPGSIPRISDMLRNVSLVFLTGNVAVDGAKLYPPNVIEISGLHFQDPRPLDEELAEVMETSKQGVIFFSLGTILKTDLLRTEAIHTFLTVFKELNQTVLWRADSNINDWDIPKNVLVRDWFDQNSILAHNNCLLFLTHGGISSTMEAIRHAVPMVLMPIFGDQDVNAANAEMRGYGLRIFYNNLTETSLRLAIETVLGDSRFKKSIRLASKIMSDQPMTSLDTAIYWMDYVIRHKGAHHLKPITVSMPLYQILLLDVIAVYFTAFLVMMILIVKLVKFICKRRDQKINDLKLKEN